MEADLEYLVKCALKKINLGPGDHLVIATKYRDEFDYDVIKSWSCLPEEGMLIFFVDDLEDIRTINEGEMARYGWVKKA